MGTGDEDDLYEDSSRDCQEQGAAQAIGERDTGSEAEAGQRQAEEFGVTEQKIADVLEGVLSLESEKVKGIVMDCIGKDKQAFVNAYEEAARKKQEEDNIKYLEKLEKRLTGIDERIQKIFVSGRYEDHYRLHERAIIYIAGQVSPAAKEQMAKKVNGWVGAREAGRAMKELESRIRIYEAKYGREKSREDEYEADMNAVKGSMRNDEFEFRKLSESISAVEEELKAMDNSMHDNMPSAEYGAERDRMARDLKKLYSQQHSAARRINRNSVMLSWKRSFCMNMRLARDESEYVLEQARSHHGILESMVNDYRKCGIAIELKQGRILLRDMRNMQERLKGIQEEFSDALAESARMRGCPPNSIPIYPDNAYDGAADVMDKMRREECLRAQQNLDSFNKGEY